MRIDLLSTEQWVRRADEWLDDPALGACASDPMPKCYALVDHLLHRDQDLTQGWSAEELCNPIAHLPGAQNTYSPILLRLSQAPEVRRGQLTTLIQRCNGSPMLSVIRSTWELDALGQHFSAFAIAALPPDGERYLFRIADTRILAAIPNCLGAENLTALLAPLQSWHYLDRASRWVSILCPATEVDPPAQRLYHPSPMALSDDEFAALLDASMIDTLIDTLCEELPAFSDQTPSQQFAEIRRLLDEAAGQGVVISDYAECVEYCLRHHFDQEKA